MNNLEFDDSGSLIDPALHDALIYRIDFQGVQVNLYCRDPGGRRTRMECRGVVHMFSAGLAEQNVVLDVCLESENDACVQILKRVVPGAGSAQEEYRAKLLHRIQARELMLLQFSPSYGGGIVVLCKEAAYSVET